MKKQIKAHEERNVNSSAPAQISSDPVPQYLLEGSQSKNAKALSSAIKNKRAEKAAKFSVPLPKVKGISEEEMFKVVKTGKKTAKKGWKRMITKPTFGASISAEARPSLQSSNSEQLGMTSRDDQSSTNVLYGLWGYDTRKLMSHIRNWASPSNYLSSPSRRTRKIPCIHSWEF